MRPLSFVVMFVAVLVSSLAGAKAQENFGTFNGELVVKAKSDGRKLELTQPFSFADPKGKLWSVPAGTVVDGASIPQVFWSVIGGPFEDNYREASVIHDFYCDRKTEPWEDVHKVFYDGMMARGVTPFKAKMMYAAVYNFGPRWIEVAPGESGKLISGQPILLDDARKALIKFVSEKDPSVEEINKFSKRLNEARTIEQLEQLLYEHADCTPILPAPSLSPSVGKTLLLCGLSAPSKRQAAIKNLRVLIDQLGHLVRTQQQFLLPAIDSYVRAPNTAKWNEITSWSNNVYGLVKLGIASVLKVEDSRAQSMAPPVDDVFEVLSTRAAMISPILSGLPMSKEDMRQWVGKYRELVKRLESKLKPLEQYLAGLE